VAPAKNIYPLEQGFAVKIEYGDKSIIKKFQEEDWDEIAFEATYVANRQGRISASHSRLL